MMVRIATQPGERPANRLHSSTRLLNDRDAPCLPKGRCETKVP